MTSLPVRAASLSLAAFLCAASPAFAHAILLASTPAAGGAAEPGPVDLRLRFNSRIDRSRSALRLVAPDGRETSLALGEDTPPDVVEASAELAPGRYRVRWQVLAVDGHVTRGDFTFTVAAP